MMVNRRADAPLFGTRLGEDLERGLEKQVAVLANAAKNDTPAGAAAIKELYEIASDKYRAHVVAKQPVEILALMNGPNSIAWGIKTSDSVEAMTTLIERDGAILDLLGGNGKRVRVGLLDGPTEYRVTLLEDGGRLLRKITEPRVFEGEIHVQANKLFSAAMRGDKVAEEFLFSNPWLFKTRIIDRIPQPRPIEHTELAVSIAVNAVGMVDAGLVGVDTRVLARMLTLPSEILSLTTPDGRSVSDMLRDIAAVSPEFRKDYSNALGLDKLRRSQS